MTNIPLAKPDTGDIELRAVTYVLKSDTLSIGPMLKKFETGTAALCGVTHAVGVSSGTAGLTLCLDALDIGPGDEVITVSFTFVATANVVLHSGATPVFVDIDADTLNIDPAAVEAAVTRRTKAILVVHVFGRPAPMDAINAIAKQKGLAVIEDACEALGARVGDRAAGAMGDVGVFGFYPNKIVTTGEGGMIVTDNPDIAERCRRLRNHGRDPVTGAFTGDRPGYNFRMSELQAAIGVAQLGRLPGFLTRRQRLAESYTTLLADTPGLVTPPVEVPDTVLSWFVYVVRLGAEYTRVQRDGVMAELRAAGIGTAAYFPAIHLLDLYRKKFGHAPGELPVTESVAARTIALPFFNGITQEQQRRVRDVLVRAVEHTGG